MRSVGREDTGAERRCAELLVSVSTAWEQHPPHILGKPDFFFPKAHLALFVHGCFWHGHENCPRRLKNPETHATYWAAKIQGNRRRDRRVARKLRLMGVAVFTVWECQLRTGRLPPRLLNKLDEARRKQHL